MALLACCLYLLLIVLVGYALLSVFHPSSRMTIVQLIGLGPVVGAGLVLLLKNYASAYLERWNMLLGLVFLFIVLVVPTGIVPGLSKLATALRRGSSR